MHSTLAQIIALSVGDPRHFDHEVTFRAIERLLIDYHALKRRQTSGL